MNAITKQDIWALESQSRSGRPMTIITHSDGSLQSIDRWITTMELTNNARLIQFAQREGKWIAHLEYPLGQGRPNEVLHQIFAIVPDEIAEYLSIMLGSTETLTSKNDDSEQQTNNRKEIEG